MIFGPKELNISPFLKTIFCESILACFDKFYYVMLGSISTVQAMHLFDDVHTVSQVNFLYHWGWKFLPLEVK